MDGMAARLHGCMIEWLSWPARQWRSLCCVGNSGLALAILSRVNHSYSSSVYLISLTAEMMMIKLHDLKLVFLGDCRMANLDFTIQ